jgi:hypothetical protein
MKRSPADLTGDDGAFRRDQTQTAAQDDPDGDSGVRAARVGLSV